MDEKDEDDGTVNKYGFSPLGDVDHFPLEYGQIRYERSFERVV